ncbi:putative AC transposase [Bienertia sinuspersici]
MVVPELVTHGLLYFGNHLFNVMANTKAMYLLKEDPSINLLLGGSLSHVRCCSHILKLVVKAATRAFKAKCDECGLRKKVISLDTPTRWNSTYKLLHDVIRYRDVLTNLYSKMRLNLNSLINNE